MLFRPFRNNSEQKSKQVSNNKTPQNYISRVMQMDPDEEEKVQKEVWKAQREQMLKEMQNAKSKVRKLGRQAKMTLWFYLFATPFALAAAWTIMYYIDKCNPGAPVPVLISCGVFLFLLFTYLFGGTGYIIYSAIFQPWVFTKVPEDKLPPMNNPNEDHRS